MNISFNINDIGKLRYHVRYVHNELSQASQPGQDSSEFTLTISYNELISRHHELYELDHIASSASSQVMRNHMSSLHSFLAYNGKTTDDVVGRELTVDFDAKLKTYSESLLVSAHTQSDRRSHLRAWRATAEGCLVEKQARNKPDTETSRSAFQQALCHAVASTGFSPLELARRANASVQALKRWLKGGIPNARALPSLRRIEVALGLTGDTLRHLIPKQRDPRRNPVNMEPHIDIPYRARLKLLTVDRYVLRESDIGACLASEWRAFFDYKTAKRPAALQRSTRGKWRLLQQNKVGQRITSYAQKGTQQCPTADYALKIMRGFLGYLTRPVTEGGFGLPIQAVQTLGWFAVPDAVNGYLEFLTARSDGLEHGGHRNVINLAGSMTRSATGYLTQQPEFAARIPSAYVRAPWADMCNETHALCVAWKQDARSVSRDPKAPIQKLLDLAEPLAPVLRAVRSLDFAATSAPTGSVAEAINKRDALLLSMLVANPLRRRNYIIMTWNENNTGALYRREDGQWRIRFHAGDFKNDGHAHNGDYDAQLPRELDNRISEYLEAYRPRLLRAAPSAPWLFPSSNGVKWTGLSKHVAKLTKTFIPECPGFGTHAFRHLVATDYLRKNPGDFLTVAVLLHDRLETVLAAYAHLREDESFARYEAHVQAIF